jgi:regulator of sirC expression with transglutaminase-like and TPR domain
MFKIFTLLALSQSPDPLYLESLYSRQDPLSLTKQLYFYAQYPDTHEGQRAKKKILELLDISSLDPLMPVELNSILFEELLKAVFKTTTKPILLDSPSINFINNLSLNHKNRTLKGSSHLTRGDLENGDTCDIDVGRGMLVLAFGEEPDGKEKILSYEAVLDFMALCVKARLSKEASNEEKVHAMNHFIFYELGYRFPAHSEHEEKIDTYTLLPSVLDNRQGVCLGVSLLYYALAQRLGLNLDIYTPPGHIFLSLHEDLNIETTARGIHMPIEAYLSLHVKSLNKRTQKELLGMALFNQSSVFLKKQDFKKAADLYEKALAFIPDDPQILELLGSCYLMDKQLAKTHRVFTKLQKIKEKNLLTSNYIVEDFFKGYITPEGLQAIFKDVDSDMQSLINKSYELEAIHKKSPKFRSALYQLGITYLQLHQYEKAFLALEKLYTQADDDPALVYYLTQLSLIRFDRPKTLLYKEKLKFLIKKHDYNPQAVQRLLEEIEHLWPSGFDTNL